jgi:hypothetical protein
MAKISLTNEELVTVREAMRSLNTYLEALDSDQVDKLVLTKHNKMLGVILSLDRFAAYEDLATAVGAMFEAEANSDMQGHNRASAWASELLDKLG